jgi:hypothetical protein
MFLVDTNVLSEARKGPRAAPGVLSFFDKTEGRLFLPVQVVGELERGITRLRRRGDREQAAMLEAWLETILTEYSNRILEFDLHSAKIWGLICGVHNQNQIDNQIAAIALQHQLTVATRNTRHFQDSGVALFNPFESELPDTH